MKKTIFIVDDSNTNLSQAKSVLDLHYKVLTMPSAIKMFSMLEKIEPQLILLDVEMPEMDGFEAMTLLQENRDYANIPVIFLTSHRDAEVEAKCFELGAVDFISKPFTTQGLLQRVRTQMNIKDLIRERGEGRYSSNIDF